jgi:hypothetical protein
VWFVVGAGVGRGIPQGFVDGSFEFDEYSTAAAAISYKCAARFFSSEIRIFKIIFFLVSN